MVDMDTIQADDAVSAEGGPGAGTDAAHHSSGLFSHFPHEGMM
jgi:hypothetical protein